MYGVLSMTMSPSPAENPSAAARHPAPRHIFSGIDHWDAGAPAAAEAEFDSVLALQPKNDLARSYKALCRLAQGHANDAAQLWQHHGFSDNTMFRVRLTEFVEQQWLERGTFLGYARLPDSLISPGTTFGGTQRRAALRRFYRRDFAGILKFLPEPPEKDELAAFLGATACEMLRDYSRAEAYLGALRPRRAEWPEPLIALGARLDVRAGHIARAARGFATIVIMGPEDYGITYYLGVICLAYEKREEARMYFHRAYTAYMVDTLEFQWWQLEQALLHPASDFPPAARP